MFCNNLTPTNLTSLHAHAILDSGVLGNFLSSKVLLVYPHLAVQPIHVKLLDNTCMESTQISSLNISRLSTQANEAHIFLQLLLANLIGMGKLYDNGYHVTFTSNNIKVHKNNKIILTGLCNTQIGMYKYKLPT